MLHKYYYLNYFSYDNDLNASSPLSTLSLSNYLLESIGGADFIFVKANHENTLQHNIY